MTAEDRANLIRQGQDGCILCLDIANAEGQEFASFLARMSDDVTNLLRERKGNSGYLLVLLVEENGNRKPADVRLVERGVLLTEIKQMWQHTRDFGTAFAHIVVPDSAIIRDLFATLDSE